MRKATATRLLAFVFVTSAVGFGVRPATALIGARPVSTVAKVFTRHHPPRPGRPRPGRTTTTVPGATTVPGVTTIPGVTGPTTPGTITTTVPTTAVPPATTAPTTAAPPATTAPTTAVPPATTVPTTVPPTTVPPVNPGVIGAARAASQPDTMPLAATSGTPHVRQVRNGVVVAEYANLGAGGPFTRTHAFNVVQPGDVFELDPAVYEGPGQYPWIGPLPNSDADYSAGIFHRPANVTIRGLTVGGRRPVIRMGSVGDYNILGHGLVEISGADNLLFENIDVDGSGGAIIDRAGIYVLDSSNVTIRNARIHGFQASQHNGVFGAGGNSGTLWLDDVRLYDNGGWDGPSHNVYINESAVDPNFTAKLTASWSSAVNVGHLFKSRAQVTVLDGNLLEGTDAAAGWDCAESFGLDVPNGGRMTVTNNVFVKAKPGPCANGIALRYGAEGMDPARAHSVTIEHNTFLARSAVWDDAGHRNVPLGFYYPSLVPTAAGAPAVPVTVRANRFDGFVTADLGPAENYRGDDFIDLPGQ